MPQAPSVSQVSRSQSVNSFRDGGSAHRPAPSLTHQLSTGKLMGSSSQAQLERRTSSSAMLKRQGSSAAIKRVPSSAASQTGGLARSFTRRSLYATPQQSPIVMSVSERMRKNGVFAGVCESCKVVMDSTLPDETDNCSYHCEARKQAEAEARSEVQSITRAESSLGMPASEREAMDRQGFDRWQARIAGSSSELRERQRSTEKDCCVCMVISSLLIGPPDKDPEERRLPPSRSRRNVTSGPSPTSSPEPSPTSASPSSRISAVPVMYPEAIRGCKQCTARYDAFQRCRALLADADVGRAMEAGLGAGVQQGTLEEAGARLKELWTLFATSGGRCRALLEDEARVGALIKRCKAALVSSDRGVRWFAEHFTECLAADKGVLDVSRSELREVCDLTPLAGRLVALDVSYNRNLVKLPLEALCSMQGLETLECAGCKNLISPPQEIARQGSGEVMAFLRSVHLHGALNTEVLLFTVGDGESGKTSTVRALMSDKDTCEEIPFDDRTIGVDIIPWKPPLGDGQLSYLVFDMAGQAVYAVTHQYFLAERAIYMLVWRAKQGLDSNSETVESALAGVREMVETWLDSLSNRVPGVPVLLVATHIDCVSEESLQQQCKIVRDIALEQGSVLTLLNGGVSFLVNCIKGDGIAELRQSLVESTLRIRSYKEALPGPWIELRKQLLHKQQCGTVWVSITEYTKMAADCGIHGVMLTVATRFLHETGSIRYFANLQVDGADARRTAARTGRRGVALARDEGGGADGKRAPPRQGLLRTISGKLQTFEEVGWEGLEGTVFISAPWMVDVMKGLVRHDREALLSYFGARNRAMARRVHRLIMHGVLHEQLAPFLWPCSGIAQAYWDTVAAGEDDVMQREAAVWRGQTIVSSAEDVRRALGLLAGFNMLTKSSRGEYAVPALLSPARKGMVDSRTFSTLDCPFYTAFDLPGLPPGFVEGIAVRLWQQTSHCDYSATAAAFYRRGTMAQMFVTEKRGEGGAGRSAAKRRSILTVRASSRALWRTLKREVEKANSFFPGMPPLRTESEIPEFEARGIQEPIQVLILSSKGLLKKGSIVTASGLPLVDVTADAFLDASTRLLYGMEVLSKRLTYQCVQKVQSKLSKSQKPTPRHAPRPGVSGILASLGCRNDTVAPHGSTPSFDGDEFWWLLGRSDASILHCGLKPPRAGVFGGRAVDVTHALECVLVELCDEMFGQVLGEEAARVLTDLLPYMKPQLARQYVVFEGGLRDSHVIDIMADTIAEVGAELLREILAQALEETLRGCEGEVYAIEDQLHEGSAQSSAQDSAQEHAQGGQEHKQEAAGGRVLVRFKMRSGGNITVGFPQKSVFGVADTRSIEDIVSREAKHPSEEIFRLLYHTEHAQGEESLSVQLHSADRRFEGQARVVLLLVDEVFGESEQCVALFKHLINAQCQTNLIPLILPGYQVRDYGTWWPSSMEELRRHALFVDMRDESQWPAKVAKEILPQVIKFLEEWRGVAPSGLAPPGDLPPTPVNADASARPDQGGALETILCQECFEGGFAHPHVFERKALMALHEHWVHERLVRMGEVHVDHPPATLRIRSWVEDTQRSTKRLTSAQRPSLSRQGSVSLRGLSRQGSIKSGAEGGFEEEDGELQEEDEGSKDGRDASPSSPLSAGTDGGDEENNKIHYTTCTNGHVTAVLDLLSRTVVRESLPCPSCTLHGDVPPYCFARRMLTLFFAEDNTNKVGTVQCGQCRDRGRPSAHRVLDILSPEVFLSYNWGRRVVDAKGLEHYTTQRLVTDLQRRIEMEADITCWLDVAGGMGAGQDHLKEMMEGVKRASVFVLFLSDAYVISKNCRRELAAAIKWCKYLVPVLLAPPVEVDTFDSRSRSSELDSSVSYGWTGAGGSDAQWWRHAQRFAGNADLESAGFHVPWSALAQFPPIDARSEILQEEGTLSDDSPTTDYVISKVLSRFHRGEYIKRITQEKYDAWKIAHSILLARINDPMLDEPTVPGEPPTPSNSMDRLKKLFDEIDADGSGGIDAEELQLALSMMNVMVSSEEAHGMVKQADLDGNGAIEFNEFVHIFDLLSTGSPHENVQRNITTNSQEASIWTPSQALRSTEGPAVGTTLPATPSSRSVPSTPSAAQSATSAAASVPNAGTTAMNTVDAPTEPPTAVVGSVPSTPSAAATALAH